MAVEVRFHPDPGEQGRAALAIGHIADRPVLRLGLAFLPLATLLAALVLAPGSQLTGGWLVVALSGSAVCFGAWLMARPAWQRQRAARAFAGSSTAAFEHGLVVSPTGLQITAGSATTTFGWDVVQQVRETTEFYLFFYARQHAVYLPKRLLDATQDASLRALVRAAAPDAGRGLAREDAAALPAI